MRLLITGGAGFIGRALQEFLQARYSYKIYAPSSSELDLTQEAEVSKYVAERKISHIIHLANRGGGRDTMGLHDIAEYNLRMFFAIMSQENRVEKILHFGSGAEYSKHKPIVSASESSYLESLPLDSYGFYKSVCSRFIESTRGNVIALRIFGCYGAGENYRYKFISNAIVKNLLRLPITIYKDCVFDYIYIDALLRIIDHFLHAKTSLAHRIYNASSGSGVALSNLAEMINATSPYKSPIHILTPGLNNEYTSDNARLLQAMPELALTPHSHAIESMREYFANNLTSLDIESIKTDPYLAKIEGMWTANNYGGGGGKYLRDSAFWLKTAIPAPRCVDRPQVLSSLHGLKNAVFSSKILESQSGKKNKHKLPNPTASGSKLESLFLSSLRADNGGAAIHKNKAQRVDSSPKILESIALESKKLSLRDFALAKSWQSIPHKSSSHTLESTFSHDTLFLSSRDFRKEVVAIHKSAKADSKKNTQKVETLESTFEKTQMDCHAIATALARNDKNNTPILNTPQAQLNLDSSKSPSDSKILDEKCGLQGKSQGSYLDGNDRRDFSPLLHFSLKAELPQAKKPTPKLARAS